MTLLEENLQIIIKMFKNLWTIFSRDFNDFFNDVKKWSQVLFEKKKYILIQFDGD